MTTKPIEKLATCTAQRDLLLSVINEFIDAVENKPTQTLEIMGLRLAAAKVESANRAGQ